MKKTLRHLLWWTRPFWSRRNTSTSQWKYMLLSFSFRPCFCLFTQSVLPWLRQQWQYTQHADNSKNTKAWAVSHNTLTTARTPRLGLCHTTHWQQQEHQVTTHWQQQEHQGLGCVTQHADNSKNTKAWAVSHNTLTPARTPRFGLCHTTHWQQQEYQDLGCVTQHVDNSKNTKAWAVSHNTSIPPRTPRLGLSHNTLTTARTLRLGLCRNTLTPARAPRLGLCHNPLTPARIPRLGLCHNTLTPARTSRLGMCHTTHWHHQEHQGLGCVTLTTARIPRLGLCHSTLTPARIPRPR